MIIKLVIGICYMNFKPGRFKELVRWQGHVRRMSWQRNICKWRLAGQEPPRSHPLALQSSAPRRDRELWGRRRGGCCPTCPRFELWVNTARRTSSGFLNNVSKEPSCSLPAQGRTRTEGRLRLRSCGTSGDNGNLCLWLCDLFGDDSPSRRLLPSRANRTRKINSAMLFHAKASLRPEGRAGLQLGRSCSGFPSAPHAPRQPRQTHAGASFNRMLAKVSRALVVKGKANPDLSTSPGLPQARPTGRFVAQSHRNVYLDFQQRHILNIVERRGKNNPYELIL